MMLRTRSRKPVTAAVLALVLTAAACGGGGGEGADEKDDTTPAASIEVTMKEFSFAPDTWTIPADTDVTVTATNHGMVDHEWVVLSEEISAEADFDDGLVITRLGPVKAATEATGAVTVAAGTYQVICTIPGHFEAGMKGTLKATKS